MHASVAKNIRPKIYYKFEPTFFDATPTKRTILGCPLMLLACDNGRICSHGYTINNKFEPTFCDASIIKGYFLNALPMFSVCDKAHSCSHEYIRPSFFDASITKGYFLNTLPILSVCDKAHICSHGYTPSSLIILSQLCVMRPVPRGLGPLSFQHLTNHLPDRP